MKKISLLLAISLSLALALAACGKGGDSSTADSGASSSVTASDSAAGSQAGSSAPAGAESTPAGSAAGAAASAPQAGADPAATSGVAQAAAVPAPVANLSGSYYSYDTERFPDDRAPYLELSAEGGFVLHLNLGDNRLGVMTGTYTGGGSGLQMSVMYCDSTDFLGQGTTSFSFTMDGANILKYSGSPLGLTRDGDSFEIKGGASSGGVGSTGQNMYIIAPDRVVTNSGAPAASNPVVSAPQ